MINKALFRTPVLVCWLRRRIMRPMSVFNLYEYIWVSPEEIMEYDYWLSERKNATYHVIEYQLSKKFLFLNRCLHFWVCRWNPMVLPFKWNPLVVLSHGTIYLVCSSNFWVCGWNPMVLPFKWNLFSSTFTWYYLFSMYF